jgi:hypothetical protein
LPLCVVAAGPGSTCNEWCGTTKNEEAQPATKSTSHVAKSVEVGIEEVIQERHAIQEQHVKQQPKLFNNAEIGLAALPYQY